MPEKFHQDTIDFIIDANFQMIRSISNQERRIDLKVPVLQEEYVTEIIKKVAVYNGWKAVTEREDGSDIISYYLFEDK